MDLISRPNYYNKLERLLGKGVLVVLTGQRRVGKSHVLKELATRKGEEPDANVIYIDKEKAAFDFIATYKDLVAYVDGKVDASRHNYVLIDEVQEIKEFERGLRNYQGEAHMDIAVTGSNSDILSSDLGTHLSGRYVEVFVQGLSYTEFLEFHRLEDNEDALAKYLNFGGLPGLRAFGLDDPETATDYLRGVYNTILVKDIIRRNKVRNVTFLENLALFIADNIGKPMSASSIQKYMVSSAFDISKNLVLDYMKATHEAFLTTAVSRYDLHGKKLLATLPKFYFGDVGLRNLIVGGRRANDMETLVENLVFQHMVRLGYEVKVGQLHNVEIDFVGTRGNEVVYVQAAYLIAEESTFRREFGNLLSIRDNYPKYVISMTPGMGASPWEGILHIPFAQFLKNGFGR